MGARLAAASCRGSGIASLCPCAGLPLWPGGPGNAQPAHLLAGTLAVLFTAAFIAGSIADSWTTSAIIPILKKGEPTVTFNYRPVAVGTPIARLY